jgi:hypothetical protein
MANGNALRAVTEILRSGERREQSKVDTALAMMQLAASKEQSEASRIFQETQFAQTKRMQEIALTQNNLQTSLKLIESEKPKIASAFGESTGITRFYQEMEEGEMAEDAITDMAKEIKKKIGKGYDSEINTIAGAVFNYYNAKDSESMIDIASRLHDASIAINQKTATNQQKKLFEAFRRLGATADLQNISQLAKKARISEANISKEYSEFLQGDYEIQSPIGIYADIPESKIDFTQPVQVTPKPTGVSVAGLKEAVDKARLNYQTLEKKVNSGVATDDEKEEYSELPGVIQQLRLDLYESSGEFEAEIDDEMKKVEEKIEAFKVGGLTGRPEYRELKSRYQQLRIESNKAVNAARLERANQKFDEEVERVSLQTGLSEAVVRNQMRVKAPWDYSDAETIYDSGQKVIKEGGDDKIGVKTRTTVSGTRRAGGSVPGRMY